MMRLCARKAFGPNLWNVRSFWLWIHDPADTVSPSVDLVTEGTDMVNRME